jgi:succinate dehydrogenase / fumarate reductase cytochrome b subunit
MAVSILHRVTGGALTVAGLALLTWWLMAVAAGRDTYGDFSAIAGTWVGLAVLIGLTWAFFQHLSSGIRHLVMDTGANFEIGQNKTSANLTIVASIVLTAALWFYILGGAK